MESIVAALSVRFRQFVCSLGGHDLLLSIEPGKLLLRCTSCPYETPGWTIKDTLVRAAERETPALVAPTAPRYV